MSSIEIFPFLSLNMNFPENAKFLAGVIKIAINYYYLEFLILGGKIRDLIKNEMKVLWKRFKNSFYAVIL